MANAIMINPLGGGGGGQIPERGVFFVDYDGSIVTAWASDEVASRTALPDNPTHDRLVAQGWNWSLANIKNYVQKYPKAMVWVGQMYKTVSRLTEIDITVTKVTGKTVTCKMSGSKDWGDGTTNNTTSHTYDDYGDYTITCNGTSIPAGTSSSSGMFGSSSSNMNRYWCTAIRVGESVTSIGNNAFRYCCSLASITIPDNVTSIGTYAFYNCYSLTSITIPNRVTSIGTYTFYNCYSLKDISISDSVTSIGDDVFEVCYSLTGITIPDSVISIGTSAFYICYSLTSITIPDRITSIAGGMFGYCYSLKNVSISVRATSIDASAFYGCDSLTRVIIPNSITNIGRSAFQNCYSVLEYDFSSSVSIPALSAADAFNNINGLCKIIVPDSLYNEWLIAANWSTYANYIYKASEV